MNVEIMYEIIASRRRWVAMETFLDDSGLLDAYLEYAKSIGCAIGEGISYTLVECTPKQKQLITEWWQRKLGD